jgi:two-component system, NtrC family, response regulator HydG
VIRFAGQRAILLDAVAMGLLRKYLVDNFGIAATRTVLTQFGYSHGSRIADSFNGEFKFETPEAWQSAAKRIPALTGLFTVDPSSKTPRDIGGLTVLSSYEAEQHLLHFGPSESPACWTICGLLSGYLSRSEGQAIFVLEDRCVAKGDAACHLVGHTRAEWGDRHEADLHYFEAHKLKDSLDVALKKDLEVLQETEKKLESRKRLLSRVAPEVDEPMGVIARSPAMRQLVDLAQRVALVDSTVLLTGESGSGKERIARLVHESSTRAHGPFIAVNCGAITETLLESELFGHSRGAFTGATQDRPVLFEAANNGTLLLDEVGEVSPGMQVKLLRALQEREVRRVGENKSRKIDVERGRRAAARRHREGIHSRGARSERWQSDAHRAAAPHRVCDALSEAQSVRCAWQATEELMAPMGTSGSLCDCNQSSSREHSLGTSRACSDPRGLP